MDRTRILLLPMLAFTVGYGTNYSPVICGGEVPKISRSIAAHGVAYPPMTAPFYP